MIVLLPGIQAGPPEFERLLPLLPDALVYPLPDATADRIEAVAALVEAALPPGAHDLVGASFGGLVATALPADRLRSLTTIGSLPFPNDAARRSGRAGRWLASVPMPIFRALYRSRVRASLEEDSADAELIARVRLPRREVLAARLRAIGHWHFPPPPIRATWMWGVSDRFVTWEKGEVAATGAEPLLLPGGHRPHLSHPSEVAGWIRSIAKAVDCRL
jgi:pimeloyl-ACP methyl ester carboxylesterase